MEQKRSEVKLSIRTHERTEVSRAEGLLRALKMEILKLKGRDAEMRRLQPIEDPIDFLQVMLLACRKEDHRLPIIIRFMLLLCLILQ